MKVLITGGAGFIGSHLVDAFMARNDQVIVIDNLSTGSRQNINHHDGNASFHFIWSDITNCPDLHELCRDCDLIIHLASSVGVKYIMENPLNSLESNVLGSIQIMKLAAAYKKRIIFFSTSEIYGKSNATHLREDDDRILGPSFRWSYSACKAVGEYYLYALGKEEGLHYNICRCFNIVGPRQVGNYGMVLPRLVQQALNNEAMTIYDDGTQIRTFTYVLDVVKMIMHIADHQEINQQTFNIGSENVISIIELAHKIKAHTNSSSSFVFLPSKEVYDEAFEDIQVRVPNIDKLTALGVLYEPMDIDRIIANVVDYYKTPIVH
ncbi:NAD-dependent epimerase/dehydratase family protein [Paenibacillus sp. 1001270B_150601_E10]|uniref:NAD-dependent epimerase/dehydratase family protein n=1 Tax=Paenibacillus sp. 1001270B_150601_E10 TaxID=2787079 RepID=UPI00189E4D80|nr:NAD-dependent epimerase/dehydratase family protein [Paenibacillus sp. 1001270B_150601_E10]